VSVGLGEGLLHHVGSVDPRSQPAVHPDRDHPPQPLSMQGDQLLARRAVTVGSLADQRFGLET
jgi:hypothetical protein